MTETSPFIYGLDLSLRQIQSTEPKPEARSPGPEESEAR